MSSSMRMRAAKALDSLLQQVAGITVRDIGLGSSEFGPETDILAHINVLGHNHALACKVKAGGEAQQIRKSLEGLRHNIVSLRADVTPVVIVPRLSKEAQAVCNKPQSGCLDLEGNGRLCLGEVFISKRSLPHGAAGHRDATGAERAVHLPGTRGDSVPNVRERSPPAGSEVTTNAFRISASTHDHVRIASLLCSFVRRKRLRVRRRRALIRELLLPLYIGRRRMSG